MRSREKLFKLAKADKRERRKEQGYFDGRFIPKVIPDKRKKKIKKQQRNMKNFIVLLFMSISLIGFAQADTTKADVNYLSETERLIDKYSSQIIDGVLATIDTLTPAAQETFKIIVRKNFWEGMAAIFFFVFFFIIMLIAYRTSDFKDGSVNGSAVLTVISAIISAVSIITIVAENSIMKVFVPEYYAIQELIDMIK